MGRHTESYRLVVTDNVPGREGVASSFNGWAEDPESAIAAYNNAVLRQVDGTTVELQRVENTSVMSSTKAASTKAAGPMRPLYTVQEDAPDADGPTDDHDPTAVSRYAAHGYVASVELSSGMARVLVRAVQSGGKVRGGLSGTVTALIDRGLMGTIRKGGDPHHLTDRGRRLASFLAGSPDLDQWIGHGSGLRRFDVPQD
jgi:hypothetical protein